MYFLNDNHVKYEYAIYCKVGSSLPYIQKIYDNLDIVYNRILEIEKKHNHYGQFFYIDNDFYNNKYNINTGDMHYYKVLRRKVQDWEEFNLKEENLIFLYK